MWQVLERSKVTDAPIGDWLLHLNDYKRGATSPFPFGSGVTHIGRRRYATFKHTWGRRDTNLMKIISTGVCHWTWIFLAFTERWASSLWFTACAMNYHTSFLSVKGIRPEKYLSNMRPTVLFFREMNRASTLIKFFTPFLMSAKRNRRWACVEELLRCSMAFSQRLKWLTPSSPLPLKSVSLSLFLLSPPPPPLLPLCTARPSSWQAPLLTAH